MFSMQDPLEQEAYEKMVIGVSTRKYRRALEGVPPNLTSSARRRVR